MPPPRPINAKPASGPPPSDDTPPLTRKLVVAKPKAPCPRIVFYAGEKFGKTSTAVNAPDPVILMARGENGYETLLSAGTVPAIPAVHINSHPELLEWLDSLIVDQQGRKTVILDAIGGFDVLAQEYVCKKFFDNDWNNPRDGFLSFVCKHGPMAFTCATFRTMEENLRAIGLTLQRLRLIDEYGATRSGEQYRGFAALPPATEFATVDEAAMFLLTTAAPEASISSSMIEAVVDDPELTYRRAARRAHPDTGGSNDLMAKVTRARTFIEKGGRE
jgi:hypothetical protein